MTSYPLNVDPNPDRPSPRLVASIERSGNTILRHRFPSKEGRIEEPAAPTRMSTMLSEQRFRNAAEVMEHLVDPLEIATIESLRQLLALWWQGATRAQWLWLAGKVSDMMDLAIKRKSERFESQLSPVAHLIIAYALLQGGDRLSANDYSECQQIARVLLAKSAESRRLTAASTVPSALENTLQTLVLAHLGDWVGAKSGLSRALKERSLQRGFHQVDVECLARYSLLLEENLRTDDFIDVVYQRSDILLSLLTHETSKQSIRPDLRDVLFRAIGRIGRADKWTQSVLEKERGPQKEKRRSSGETDIMDDSRLEIESPRFRYSNKTRAMGAIVFITMTQSSGRCDEAMGVLRQLFYHGFWISPHHVADLCSQYTALGRSMLVLECYTRLVKAQEDLSHTALRRMMYLLLENGYVADAADVQDQILKHHPASDRDKEALAFHHATRGECASTVGALRAAFGDSFMRDIRSLRLLLEVNIAAKDMASADRIINTIATLATSSTPHLNFLLNFYAVRGKVTQALALFDAFLDEGYGRPDMDTFRALVGLFEGQGDMKSVDMIVQAAVESGMTLDGPFCGRVLEAGIKVQDWATVARRWSSYPPEIKTDPSVITAIQKSFVYLAVPFDFVIGFFRQIRSPTVEQWHLIILSACDAGRPDLGRLLLKEMDRRARYIVGAPDANRYIFTTLMHGYLRTGKREMAKKTYDEMIARDIAPSSVTYAMIVNHYLQGKVSHSMAEHAHQFAISIWDRAQQHKLPEKGDQARLIPVKLFGGLLNASSKLGRIGKVKMYYNLIAQQAEPSMELRTMLMQAHRRAGQVSPALAQWKEIFANATRHLNSTGVDESAQKPNTLVRPLCIILETLATKGLYRSIVDTWKSVVKAGFGLDSECYNTYAKALARSGNVNAAFWIVEHILLPRHDEVLSRADASKPTSSSVRPLRPSTASFTGKEPLLQAEGDMDASREDRRNSITRARDLLKQSIDTVPMSASEVAGAANAPPKPSDLRPSSRSLFHANDSSIGQWEDHDPVEITRQLLETWRPGDSAWRPSNALRETLNIVQTQLHQLIAHRLRLSQSDKPRVAARASGKGTIFLPGFGVHIQSRGGVKTVEHPATVLDQLNTNFPRTAEMLAEWRARHKGRRPSERSTSETELIRFQESLRKSHKRLASNPAYSARRRNRIRYRIRVVRLRLADVRVLKRMRAEDNNAFPMKVSTRAQLAAVEQKRTRAKQRSLRRKQPGMPSGSDQGGALKRWIGLDNRKWKLVLRHNEARRMDRVAKFKGRWGLRKRVAASAMMLSSKEERKVGMERLRRRQQVQSWKQQQESYKMLGLTRLRPKTTVETARAEVAQEVEERMSAKVAADRPRGRRTVKRYRRMTYGTKPDSESS